MTALGKEQKKLVCITAAMREGTGLKRFAKEFPDRFFDVGIAEEHAVSFAAGLALGGMIPVVAIYSSFLQRAVDQIVHDVCMQNLHVIFAIDRAGPVSYTHLMKRKQFVKGINQIAQEGAIQIFQEFNTGMEEIIVGVAVSYTHLG